MCELSATHNQLTVTERALSCCEGSEKEAETRAGGAKMIVFFFLETGALWVPLSLSMREGGPGLLPYVHSPLI